MDWSVTVRRFLRVLVVACLAGGVVTASPTQATTLMVIQGTITDTVGRPLPDVWVTNNRGALVRTDAEGYYRMEFQSISTYNVTAFRSGLNAQSRFVDPVTALQPVDFEMTYRLTGWLSPPVFNNNPPKTLSVTARSAAPVQDQCITFLDFATGAQVELALQDPTSSTWTGPFPVPADSREGRYGWRIGARDCLSGVSLTNDHIGSYFIDNTAPVPVETSPVWASTASPRIRARFEETGSGVRSTSVRAWVDGAAVPATLESSFPPQVRAEATGLAAGAHTAEIRVADYAENEAGVTFTFTIEFSPPSLTDPSPTGQTDDRTPLISILAADDLSGLDTASISMVLSNGTLSSYVGASFNPGTGRIEYQVPDVPTGLGLGQFPLLDGSYDVEVSVSDRARNPSTSSWSFVVKTLP